jgi:hypothetical protein
MPPKKRVKKSRARKPVKKGLKQKQKQKQQQKVNVSVSAGGSGGGGTQFIPMPMPSAPAFDYAQLANLIRPAATVDVPIRAQANPEPIAARAPEVEALKESTKSSRAAPSVPSFVGEMPAEADFLSENEGEIMVAKARKVRSDAGKSRKKKEEQSTVAEMERAQKQLAREGAFPIGPTEGDIGRRFEKLPAIQRSGLVSLGGGGGEYERMREAQKSGSFM